MTTRSVVLDVSDAAKGNRSPPHPPTGCGHQPAAEPTAPGPRIKGCQLQLKRVSIVLGHLAGMALEGGAVGLFRTPSPLSLSFGGSQVGEGVGVGAKGRGRGQACKKEYHKLSCSRFPLAFCSRASLLLWQNMPLHASCTVVPSLNDLLLGCLEKGRVPPITPFNLFSHLQPPAICHQLGCKINAHGESGSRCRLGH